MFAVRAAFQQRLRGVRRMHVQKKHTTDSNSFGVYAGIAGGVVAAVAAYYSFGNSTSTKSSGGHAPHEAAAAPAVAPVISDKKPSRIDYQAVAKDVAALMEADESFDRDQGNCGPILVRLAWHASGTYDAATNTGGSDGSTMRLSPESGHGANAGLKIARDLLEPIKQRYGPALSYADLWTLAGCVAIQEMGGPTIPWRAGRMDKSDCNTPDGRLPDATQGADHLRKIFNRMGFNDQEIVALSGAHCLGRCHTDRSGFTGPWTFAPTTFSNMYFTELLKPQWIPKQTDTIVDAGTGKTKTVAWKGPLQYTDKPTRSLMMLPTDMVLLDDPKFRPLVERYAADSKVFFEDFARAFEKLLHLGVNEKCAMSKPIILLRE